MTAILLVSAGLYVIAATCLVSPYFARLVAAALRAHAAALDSAKTEYRRVFGRCARSAGIRRRAMKGGLA